MDQYTRQENSRAEMISEACPSKLYPSFLSRHGTRIGVFLALFGAGLYLSLLPYGEEQSRSEERALLKKTNDFFQKIDLNGDGVIERSELEQAMKMKYEKE